MKVKIKMVIRDDDGNIQDLYMDGELESRSGLSTHGGKLYLSPYHLMPGTPITIYCIPE